jgi:hypothetical protein
LTWYGARRHISSADAVIRIFRLAWKFSRQLGLSEEVCPWNSVDLSKARLQLDAVDVVYGFASLPLKDLLGELLAKAATTTGAQRLNPGDPHRLHGLQVQLAQAKSTAVERLRSCGRLDLVPPVLKLTVDDLVALRESPVIALAWPPGRILLDHRRREALAALRPASLGVDRYLPTPAPSQTLALSLDNDAGRDSLSQFGS